MPFRVYSGPKGAEDVSAIDKEQMLFKELGSLDDALLWARHVERTGASRCLSKVTTGRAWTAVPLPTRSGLASASRLAANPAQKW